jgi:hypothetical protein
METTMNTSAEIPSLSLEDLIYDFECACRPWLEDLLSRYAGASWVDAIDEWLETLDDDPETATTSLDLHCALVAMLRCLGATIAASEVRGTPATLEMGGIVIDLDIDGVGIATAALHYVAAIAVTAYPERGRTIIREAGGDTDEMIRQLSAQLLAASGLVASSAAQTRPN